MGSRLVTPLLLASLLALLGSGGNWAAAQLGNMPENELVNETSKLLRPLQCPYLCQWWSPCVCLCPSLCLHPSKRQRLLLGLRPPARKHRPPRSRLRRKATSPAPVASPSPPPTAPEAAAGLARLMGAVPSPRPPSVHRLCPTSGPAVLTSPRPAPPTINATARWAHLGRHATKAFLQT